MSFIYSVEGRSPASSKVIKILEWRDCRNPTEAKSFLGICTYYRIWIQGFGEIAAPIYKLMRKGVKWHWGPEQEQAIERLKLALTSAPILIKLDYRAGAGDIVLGVDASLVGWGAVLGQLNKEGRKRVSRYESGLWNQAERGYDATKRECRGILKALQKLRHHLYGVHFILETDANTLVAQLNKAVTDLLKALLI